MFSGRRRAWASEKVDGKCEWLSYRILDAVLADLKQASPDVIVHGGDLVGSGARPAEVVDCIRDLKWPGVQGNAEEMLWNPDRVAEYFRPPALQRWREMVSRNITAT